MKNSICRRRRRRSCCLYQPCTLSKVDVRVASVVLSSLQQQYEQQQHDISELQEHVQKLHVLTKQVDDELEIIVHSICRIQGLLQDINFPK